MYRWENVQAQTIDGMTLKMYRPPFEAEEAQSIPYENKEMDHYAFQYLGTEIFMYKILDLNFVSLMEERFVLDRVRDLKIPTKEKSV
jgi:hypothetical protein